MSTIGMALVAVQGMVFAGWAVQFFVLLFRWRARAVAATGSGFPGPISQLAAMRASWTDPEDAPHWRRWGIGLGALIALSVLSAAMNRG